MTSMGETKMVNEALDRALMNAHAHALDVAGNADELLAQLRGKMIDLLDGVPMHDPRDLTFAEEEKLKLLEAKDLEFFADVRTQVETLERQLNAIKEGIANLRHTSSTQEV